MTLLNLMVATLAHAAPGDVVAEVAAGRPVLVSFWASWCQPCRSELPRLEAMQERIDPSRVGLLTVNIDRSSRAGRALADRLDLTIPVVWDPQGEIARHFDPPALPATFLVDSSGTIVHQWLGELEDPQIREAETLLNALAAEK